MPVKFSVPDTMARRGYSQIAEITGGKLILIAGQVPHDVNDKMVGEGNFEAQVEQVFKNLGLALKAAGGDWKNLVKINNYCHISVTQEIRNGYRPIRDRYINTAPAGQHLHLRAAAGPAQLAVRDGRDRGDRRVDIH